MTKGAPKFVIDKFDTEWGDLSNFSASSFIFRGAVYPTAEHAFQAAKVQCEVVRAFIRMARTPGEAKLLGNAFKDHPNWDGDKLSVMGAVLTAKFSTSRYLSELLLSTGEAELVEGNTWGDRFWGQVDGEGENHLGRLLMALREELRTGNLQVADPTPTVEIIRKAGRGASLATTKLNHPHANQKTP